MAGDKGTGAARIHVGVCATRSDCTMDSLDGPPALLHEIHPLLEIAATESAASKGGLVINMFSNLFRDFQVKTALHSG